MNKNCRYLILFIALFSMPLFGDSQSYTFPIQPGTSNWKKFTSHKEKIDALQISEEVLNNINTKELIQICLNYPLLMEAYAYDNLKDGLEITLTHFNGFQELLSRNDAAKLFVEAIGALKIEEILNLVDNTEKGGFALKFSLYEMMITDSVLLSKLNSNENLVLLKDLREKQKDKEKYNEIFGQLGKYTSSYALSRLLVKMHKVPITENDIFQFSDKMQLHSLNTIETIISITDNILKNKN